MQHSLANYPKEFIECVVTKGKICLQFGNVDVKLRYKEGGEYIKLPSTVKALPIPVTGTKVDISAIGCQLPVLFSMLDDLVGALGEQFSLHIPDKDKKEYITEVENIANYFNYLITSMKKEMAWKKRRRKERIALLN